MLIPEIIRKKRDGLELSAQEIQSFFAKDVAADYQLTAMLMAIFQRGMSVSETSALTQCMRDSGETLSWKEFGRPVVDKHSTGGVGDKTTLMLVPLCSLFEVTVPTMSGRGLGHTGGTLDKLESIRGMNVLPTEKNAKEIVANYRGVFLGQTAAHAPLDKKLYALRDVTATVESIPLITSSILSKKLASGVEHLVMDVKFGSGGFMVTKERAQALAQSIENIGADCGMNVKSILSTMDQPLGRAAGNHLEVQECIALMRGDKRAQKESADTLGLTIKLAEAMLRSAGVFLEGKFEELLSTGKVFERFCKIIAAQGGDVSLVENPSRFKSAEIVRAVFAIDEGKVQKIDVRELGMAIVGLGGGRVKVTDAIDHSVGMTELAHLDEEVNKTRPLCVLHAANESAWTSAAERIRKSYKVN